ncbi:hypothetical protein SDJN02_05414, partial [Cucurbita argyrosperma subsp. argyrosperma]
MYIYFTCFLNVVMLDVLCAVITDYLAQYFQKDMGGRGVIGLYMVAQERQLQNRRRMLAESLKDVESGGCGESV